MQHPPILNQVAGQQEVGNALLDGVLVPAVCADELALRNRRLDEQAVQVARQLVRFEGLCCVVVVVCCRVVVGRRGREEGRGLGCGFGERGEAEL